MAQKNTTLRALIGETLYDLMPKGSVYNIYVDDITTLAEKLQEIITSLNGKVTPEQLEEAMLEKGILKRELLPDGYPYSGMTEILPETAAVITDDGYPITQPLGLTVGEAYEVSWNGSVYSCVAESFVMDGVAFAALGEVGVLGGGDPTGEYPFVLLAMPDGMTGEGVYAAFMPLDGSETGTLSVRGIAPIPIDRKWLPEGYPYILEGGTVVLEETTLSGTDSSSGVALPVELNPDVTYRVTWNGAEYTVAPNTLTVSTEEFTYWGNPSLLGVTGGDEPFIIAYGESVGWIVAATDGSATPTIRIVTERSYIPMSRKFLPGGGSLNLSNGAASGSLIGTGAKKESDTYSIGTNSMAVGYQSAAAGIDALAFGSEAIAGGDCSAALGNQAEATGHSSFATGEGAKASGLYSQAEGYSTKAEEMSAHAEGSVTTASGRASHSEGTGTTASGNSAHAEGLHTIAASSYQHVQGRYNLEDAAGKYAHIVGNGTESVSTIVRSNAHTLDWSGNAWFAGSVEGTAMILTSPGGKRFSVTVDDSGALTAAEITE